MTNQLHDPQRGAPQVTAVSANSKNAGDSSTKPPPARQDKTKAKAKRSRRNPSLYSGSSIVPKQGIAGQALLTVIAIMAFLACLTLGGVFMVRDTALGWQNDISREITVQIRPFENIDMAKSVLEARQLLLAFPGIEEVSVLDEEQNAKLLEPFLGSGVQIEELPIPALLTLTLSEGERPDLDAVRKELISKIPGASLDDHRSWIDRLNTMATTTVAIGAIIFLLMMTATILSVVFATRGAMAANREVIEVLHFVGAERSYIAREFETHFLRLGIIGSVAGGFGAVFVFLALGFWSSINRVTAQGDQVSALFGSFSVGGWGLFGIIVVSIIIAALAGLTSRFTVMKHVSQLESYGAG